MNASGTILVAIRYALDSHHTYDFVEGEVPSPIAPAPGTETFQYADETSTTSCSKALKDIEAYVTEFGPFDGIIAFSTGAALGATLLVREQKKRQRQVCKSFGFKCAIFFSGGIPVDPVALLEQEKLITLQPSVHGEIIDLPTAHIWGSNDTLYPTHGPVLKELCKATLRETFVHQGGHEIPGPDNKVAIENMVKIIKRTIEVALTLQ